MIKGIGIDIIELDRIKAVQKRQPRLSERILTLAEREQLAELAPARQIEFIAGRFAAKEAYAKAKGTGIGAYLSFQDIEIMRADNGKPYIVNKQHHERSHLSITHSKQYAVAQVVIEE
ncbi:holo-[acyl-carrier protein] synthase [Bacillus sp. JCM 19046]|nr:holo-[acyl-carrier protein] synthase [Bacillus sp. JCM 19045]GAF16080.1 holo-[acyl-carrier protein] synthase [Bacillus sp. JCM 19046]